MRSNYGSGKEQKYIKKIATDIEREKKRLYSLRMQIDRTRELIESLDDKTQVDALQLDQAYADIKEIQRLTVIMNDYIEYYRSVSEKIKNLTQRVEKVRARAQVRLATEEISREQRDVMELATTMQAIRLRDDHA